MDNNKKIIVAIVAAVLIGGIVWYYRKKSLPAPAAATPPPGGAAPAVAVKDTKPETIQKILALVDPKWKDDVNKSLVKMNEQELADMLTLITLENRGTNIKNYIASANPTDAARYRELQTRYEVFT